jgi:hypothetical protein
MRITLFLMDPLDAFMMSLYGAGDVEMQKELTAAARVKHVINTMPPPARRAAPVHSYSQ